jgi:hypothetical protein
MAFVSMGIDLFRTVSENTATLQQQSCTGVGNAWPAMNNAMAIPIPAPPSRGTNICLRLDAKAHSQCAQGAPFNG